MLLPSSPARVLKPAIATLLGLTTIAQLAVSSSPAAAQGFFQSLFGFSAPPPYAQQPRFAPRPAPQRKVIAVKPRPGSAPDEADRPARGGHRLAPEGSGGYTTVCVRMCDGFYFPISHRVPRGRFHRDAEACTSRCGESEARLFYYPSAGGDMRTAVDLSGRSYARLPVAFMHRKKLVAGCACRPEPWSVAAQIRHEGYVIAAGGGGRGVGTLTVVAGNYDAKPPPAAPAPDPVSPPDAAEPGAPGAGRGAEAADPAATQHEPATTPAPTASPAPTAGQRSTRVAATVPRPRLAAVPRRPAAAHQQAGRLAPMRTTPLPRQALAAQSRQPARVASAGWGGGTRMVWPGDAR